MKVFPTFIIGLVGVTVASLKINRARGIDKAGSEGPHKVYIVSMFLVYQATCKGETSMSNNRPVIPIEWPRYLPNRYETGPFPNKLIENVKTKDSETKAEGSLGVPSHELPRSMAIGKLAGCRMKDALLVAPVAAPTDSCGCLSLHEFPSDLVICVMSFANGRLHLQLQTASISDFLLQVRSRNTQALDQFPIPYTCPASPT